MLRKGIRIAAVVGIVAASAFISSGAHAYQSISFAECANATPGAPPEPTLTPPPVDGAEPTPEPQPGATPPPQNCMPSEGERIWGTRTLQWSVSQNNYQVDRVTISILSQEPNIPSPSDGKPVMTWTAYDGTPYQYDWNSVATTTYNGTYKVVVDAHNKARFGQPAKDITSERVDLNVDNPPNAVGAPKILATTLGSVTLEWPRALEPDVVAYTVYRATSESPSIRPAYSAFKQVGITSGPSFRDSTVQPGTQWYSVRVTRRSVVTPDIGISSSLSPMSSAAVVQSPAQATPKPGSSGGAGGKQPPTRYIPYRQLAPPRPSTVARSIPDAPFAYKLPYDTPEGGDGDNFGAIESGTTGDQGPSDPRGAVLPVAVGMFLVSSALAVGRMPY